MDIDRLQLTVGEDVVTARVRGQSVVRVANILGRQVLNDGSTRIWLDRLIHPAGTATLRDGAVLSGAISTIVTLGPDGADPQQVCGPSSPSL